MARYFKVSEFRCKCGREDCDAPPMRKDLLEKLEALREEWGQPLRPTSGTRCKLRNDDPSVKGAPKSEHLFGNAVDFYFSSPKDLERFVSLAEKFGFTGIGHGNGKVHIDCRKYPARWTY